MKLHKYQELCVQHLLDNPSAGLFLDMGLGKTLITLTAVEKLLYDDLEARKVLIIAPKRVADHTWAAEVSKWEALKHLTVSKILGTEMQRRKALKVKADLYTVNRENVVWLVATLGGAWDFDTVVIDELSSFKNHSTARFKALKMVRPKMKRVIGLTGTPAPNGLIDLFSQMFLLDGGERLGKSIGKYREQYFKAGKRNGQIIFNYIPKDKDCERQIYDKIGDICISMTAKEYLKLPKRVDTIEEIEMDEQIRLKYDEFERDAVLSMDGDEITALNAAGLTNKLLQFCNGAVYGEEKNFTVIHDLKLEALEDRIEAANGQPVLVFYQFKSDVARIKERLKAYKPHELGGQADIEAWNAGRIPVLLAHPASAGHGLNLQYGGHYIEWFGLTWSLELYMQAVARLDRQGQQNVVTNNRLMLKGTVEEKVLKALEGKREGQDNLIEAVKAIVAKWKPVK